ncbi:MAG TPA: hypothetical protein VGI70_01700, partial [Polyangiales bacterium]
TGAHSIHGAIRDKWNSLGGLNVTGFPTTDELSTPDGHARFNDFNDISIYWTAQFGAFEINGAIRNTFKSIENWVSPVTPAPPNPYAQLGVPTSDETSANDGRGKFNNLEKGAIYWSPETGVGRIAFDPIYARWRTDGGENAIGYPVGETNTDADDRFCLGHEAIFRRADGTGGMYCQGLDGGLSFRPLGLSVAGLPSQAITMEVTVSQPPSSGAMLPDTASTGQPDGSAYWLCATRGIPSGDVSTQYDFARCSDTGANGAFFVQPPADGLWVCSWAEGAIDNYRFDQQEPNALACNGGERYHLSKLPN